MREEIIRPRKVLPVFNVVMRITVERVKKIML